MKKILQSLKLFLILSSFVSCAQKPIATKFDGEWTLCKMETAEKPLWGLSEPDLLKLREVLIRCGGIK